MAAIRSVSPSLIKLTSSLRFYTPKLPSNQYFRRRGISAAVEFVKKSTNEDNKIVIPAATNQSVDNKIVLPTNQSSGKLLRIRHTVFLIFPSFYIYGLAKWIHTNCVTNFRELLHGHSNKQFVCMFLLFRLHKSIA